jgi:hypothetical protein
MFWTFLRSPIARGIGICLAVAAVAWSAYLAVNSRAVARCTAEHELVRLHDAEAAHQYHLAEVERGNALSAELVKTQRRLNETKSEYLAYANAIGGNGPDPVRMLAHYAARGEPLPETPSPPTGAAPPVSAAALGANIAENYARCLANAAQLDALIRWVDGHQGTVK